MTAPTIIVIGSGGGGGGSSWGSLANVVTDYGATGDGTTDDTAAIQSALDDLVSGLNAGLFFPPGIYSINPVNVGLCQGFTLQGSGAPGDTNVTLNRGTYIRARAGNAGKPLINLDGCADFTIRALTVWGYPSATLTGATNGIRLQNVALSGIGSGVGLLEQVVFLYCAVGFDAGSIDGGDGGVHDTNNAADITFLRCSWNNCTECFQSSNAQNENYSSGQLTVAGDPRFILSDQNQVVIEGGNNLGSADGAVFKLDGGGTFTARYCALPSTTSQVLDSGSSGGQYRIVDCWNASTFAYIPAYGNVDTRVIESGTATLSGGTVTITSANTPAAGHILVTPDGTTNAGELTITGRSAGVSFTVGSLNVLDARTFAYAILAP